MAQPDFKDMISIRLTRVVNYSVMVRLNYWVNAI